MEKIKEEINDIINALPMLKDFGGIDAAAHKTLDIKLKDILKSVEEVENSQK